MDLKKISALFAAAGLALGLAACSNDNGDTTAAETTTAVETSVETETAQESDSPESTPAPELPTAAELNGVLQRAADPEVPMEERVQTVQGGETAPELFDTMTASQQESGADFQVVDPVFPGYAANSVLTTVNFNQPDQPTQLAENVEFIYEDGNWKLSQSWACTLITNTVAPEEVPEMCQAGAPAQQSNTETETETETAAAEEGDAAQ